MDKKTVAGSFSKELRRMPIDYQRRVKWTFRIAAAWLSSVLIGAGVFIISKPYIDKRREEKLKSGEFFREIREGEEKYGLKRSFKKPLFGDDEVAKELQPPPYLMNVIGQVLKEEENKPTKEST